MKLFLLYLFSFTVPDGFSNQTGEINDAYNPTNLHAATSYVFDPEVIFLRKRLFDDLTRTRTLDCDDQDAGSNISSYDSDSVALSVIVDQDLGLVGDTIPPNISPPPIPDLKNENTECPKFNDISIDKTDTWSITKFLNGSQIYLNIIS